MKYLLLFIFIINLNAKLIVSTSIEPVSFFINKIAKSKVKVNVFVKNASPHTYEPKPSQMKYLSNSSIYFDIGLEFDQKWVKKFKFINKKLIVVNLYKNLQKGKDPHIWLSPENVKVISKQIYLSLSKIDKKNSSFYKQNYLKFLQEINSLQLQIKNILKHKPKAFIVFHPSWGYFAKEFGLVQIPVKVEAKEIKFKTIIKIVKLAKKYNVKTLITSPLFSDKSAKIIANETNLQVAKFSPIAYDWDKNLIKLANSL